MANSPMAVFTFMALALAAALLSAAGPVSAQNCGCQSGFCCSKFGFCGTTDPYCGDGCQSGPCTGGSGSGGGSSSGGVGGIVTDAFFNGIKSQSGGGCAGTSFYTRAAFLNAAGSYTNFATGSSAKQEIAAFFAHVTHETGHFCYIEEINGASHSYCQASAQWPCAAGRTYYGRGPLQISWNYNYGAAGKSIGFDGINNPQTVAQDPVVAFKTALWFWMTNVHGALPQGFGATTKAINSIECNGGNTQAMNARVGYYKAYCQQLGVDPGGNLTC